MTIPLFRKDTGHSLLIRTSSDKQANATIQIFGYLITKEIYFGGYTLVYRLVRYVNQFPIAIKQFRETFTGNFAEILNLLCAEPTSLENARLYQYARSQLLEDEKMSAWENLATEVRNKINNSVGLIAENLQPALDEVFHVGS